MGCPFQNLSDLAPRSGKLAAKQTERLLPYNKPSYYSRFFPGRKEHSGLFFCIECNQTDIAGRDKGWNERILRCSAQPCSVSGCLHWPLGRRRAWACGLSCTRKRGPSAPTSRKRQKEFCCRLQPPRLSSTSTAALPSSSSRGADGSSTRRTPTSGSPSPPSPR